MEEREILDAIIAALEELVETAEHTQRFVAASSTRIEQSVEDIEREAVSANLSEGLTAKAFDRWLDARSAEFEKRYGSDWRARLEKAAKFEYGDDWKRVLLCDSRKRRYME